MRAEPPARIRPYKAPFASLPAAWLRFGGDDCVNPPRGDQSTWPPAAAEKEMTENLTCEGKCCRAWGRA
jgi:hypothetical protein